ncbi:Sulfide:quinone oxidoreductase, mitochondrial [Leucoagaricus sp. SymC.cos]|nr:Sulfide:quinone oxidoreductase, mitochondrial [Leucoagaricus sp. SymC.cos]
MLSQCRTAASRSTFIWQRHASTSASTDKYKILVVGGGSGGISVANQIFNRFKDSGKALNDGDVAIVDAAEYHYYQPGWTLVGSGLSPKTDFRKPLASLVPKHITLISDNVKSFAPNSSIVTTTSGRDISYDILVVAAGLQVNWNGIKGLSEALMDPKSGVSSIYSYNTCDKAWDDIESLRSGKAVFTQPAGIIKCAGAPQKIMWMAWDRFRRTDRGDKVAVDFYTGMPTMFAVKKYSDTLNALREERKVGGHFQHNLIAVDSSNHKATFKKPDGSTTDVEYTTLHATPPMGPLEFIKQSPLADAAGWVSVDSGTLQHTNSEFANVFSLGDCSSLPTSKTAAAITAQAPVLTENVFSFLEKGQLSGARYDGYTSCPLLTGYGELLLAEFKYDLEPKETFSSFVDQAKSHRAFYWLKKKFFPSVYWEYMVKGQWFGTNAFSRPQFS